MNSLKEGKDGIGFTFPNGTHIVIGGDNSEDKKFEEEMLKLNKEKSDGYEVGNTALEIPHHKVIIAGFVFFMYTFRAIWRYKMSGIDTSIDFITFLKSQIFLRRAEILLLVSLGMSTS